MQETSSKLWAAGVLSVSVLIASSSVNAATESQVAGWTILQTDSSCSATKRDKDFGLQISSSRFAVLDFAAQWEPVENATTQSLDFVFDGTSTTATAVRRKLIVPPFGNMVNPNWADAWQVPISMSFLDNLEKDFAFSLNQSGAPIAEVSATGGQQAMAALKRCIAAVES